MIHVIEDEQKISEDPGVFVDEAGPSEFLKLTCISNGFFSIFFARHTIAFPHGEENGLSLTNNAAPSVSTHSQLSTSS